MRDRPADPVHDVAVNREVTPAVVSVQPDPLDPVLNDVLVPANSLNWIRPYRGGLHVLLNHLIVMCRAEYSEFCMLFRV